MDTTLVDTLLVDMAKEHLHTAHLMKRAHERLDELEKRMQAMEQSHETQHAEGLDAAGDSAV